MAFRTPSARRWCGSTCRRTSTPTLRKATWFSGAGTRGRRREASGGRGQRPRTRFGLAQPSADHVVVDAWEASGSAEGWANPNGVWGPRPQPPEAPRRPPYNPRRMNLRAFLTERYPFALHALNENGELDLDKLRH